MLVRPPIARRTFLADMGRGAFAIAIVGLVGCSPSTLATFTPGPAATGAGDSPDAGTPPQPTDPGAAASSPRGSASGGGVAWTRVNLGFVSAYLLVRGGEVALVDTGVFDSSDEIGEALTSVNLGWESVAHVIGTHNHNDHIGSIATVMQRAPAATVSMGAEDIAGVGGGSVNPVGDGDTVFDLRIITTPGHTPGSISVLDPVAGVLVVGDAMGTEGGKPVLPGSRFTADMDEAKRSIVKLGALRFETLLVGHGDPIESGAAALVAELGAAG